MGPDRKEPASLAFLLGFLCALPLAHFRYLLLAQEGMSSGAPWERGVGAAGAMPLRAVEVPGLVPDTDGDELNTKEARNHRHQRGRRQW